MIKTSKSIEAYKALGRLKHTAPTPDVVAEIKRSIRSSSGLIVSRAAELVAHHGLRNLTPDLVAVFPKLLQNGSKTDKGCRAKIAIVQALDTMNTGDSDVFMAGITCVQMEPAFGGPEDTAITLRSQCALALAKLNYPDAQLVLVERLVDPARSVRTAAVKALTYIAEPEGELLLRLKVLCGDPEVEVTAECFQGLMTMSPTRSLEFVAGYLAHHDLLILEAAALALGSSHLPEAFEKLREAWYENPFAEVRRSLLLPIALTRFDEAFALLLTAVAEPNRATTADAISALKLFPDERYVEKVRAAVNKRADRDLTARFRDEFGRTE